MENIATKIQYNGSTTPVPTNAVHTAEELNDRIVELEGSVTDSGQNLDAADAGQLSKAMFANGVAAQSMLDIGGVNTVVLTPITGASGLRVATPIIQDYSLLDGAIFSFKALHTNTGDMTVNVGQTGGTLIGAQPLFLQDGTTQTPANTVVSNNYYSVRYTSEGGGAFILMGVMYDSEGGFNDYNVDSGAGEIKTRVYTKYFKGDLDADVSTSVTHGVANGLTKILHVSATCFDDNLSLQTVSELFSGASASKSFNLTFSDTVVIISNVGSVIQGNAYNIKIDYIL